MLKEKAVFGNEEKFMGRVVVALVAVLLVVMLFTFTTVYGLQATFVGQLGVLLALLVLVAFRMGVLRYGNN